jgi:hypothetical protein
MTTPTFNVKVRNGRAFEVATIVELCSRDITTSRKNGNLLVQWPGASRKEKKFLQRFISNLCYVENVSGG